MTQRIERVDTIPIIYAMLVNMGVEKTIDSIFRPHGNWGGLGYGQLSVLFVTYVLHSLTHRLSSVESWMMEHKTNNEQTTGWRLKDRDATDDRLCILVGELGQDDKNIYEFQLQNRMKTSRPTAERMLAQFDNLNLLIEQKQEKIKAVIAGGLTETQKRILSTLGLSEDIYNLSFTHAKIKKAT